MIPDQKCYNLVKKSKYQFLFGLKTPFLLRQADSEVREDICAILDMNIDKKSHDRLGPMSIEYRDYAGS